MVRKTSLLLHLRENAITVSSILEIVNLSFRIFKGRKEDGVDDARASHAHTQPCHAHISYLDHLEM